MIATSLAHHFASTEQLNQACLCHTLNRAALQGELEKAPALTGLYAQIQTSRPHLFADTSVFLHNSLAQRISTLVSLLSRLLSSSHWDPYGLATAPTLAQHNPGNLGSWLGFDFHLGPTGPQLIEINTNPGGLLLNLFLARAQQACCPDAALWKPRALAPLPHEQDIFQLFLDEWRQAGHHNAPSFMVIVDEQPETQYLYPEFQLFRQLIEQQGLACAIVDPSALHWNGQTLTFQDRTIDIVYNRLTDFYWQLPEQQPLLAAYQAGQVVVTPHPHAHARYANKHHLTLLSDPTLLAEFSLDTSDISLLTASIPQTLAVTPLNAEYLWSERRQWFFKPHHGFGSRAAYRGDKLTRRVWQDILQHSYVAQRLALPSRRTVLHEQANFSFKLDIRAYAYKGNVWLLAARLYSGQTTNFRTPGGGFAPVFIVENQTIEPGPIHLSDGSLTAARTDVRWPTRR